MVQIDLNAQTIPLQRRVWRLFPGGGYRFLSSMIDSGLGYLDLPGFQIPENASIAQLNQGILRSRDIRAQLLGISDPTPPGRTTVSRLRSAAYNFYQDAPESDYVVLPETLRAGLIWVGQFTSKRIEKATFTRYGDMPIPARAIKWAGPFQENTISSDLSRSLRNENPFTLLPASTYLEVFSLAHGSFIYVDRHVSTVYNDLDDFLDADEHLLTQVKGQIKIVLQKFLNPVRKYLRY